ncbi:NAD(P)-dependent oxidoreductase [Sinomicrobium sp.]
MKILVFGATGSVGKEIVKQALNQGHQVTAFVRNLENSGLRNSANVKLIKGDVTYYSNVEKALRDQDAVLCAIGDGKIGKVRNLGTKNIVEAMEKNNVKRLICQSTLGMGESYDNLNFLWRYIMFGFLLKKAFQDHKLQEQHILNSDLDYTIVRPSALTDGELTNKFKRGFDGNQKNLSLKISRADVAYFMLEQLENRTESRLISISD